MSQRMTIIGGGPGGYTAAFAAAERGADVTLIEQARLGGTCLHHGCIPTKSLKASADALDMARRLREFGIVGAGQSQIDMPAVLARKNRIRDILCAGLEKTCAKHKITLLNGQATLQSPRTVRVMHQGHTSLIDNDILILATGSTACPLPGILFDTTHILSSEQALAMPHIPPRLLIVGGGVVGCELACIYAAFGAKVTIVEAMHSLLPLPSVDGDVSKILLKEMKKRGIICELGRVVQDVCRHGNTVKGVLAPSSTPVEADAVLVTIGRVPYTRALGLDAAGIATHARGWIRADTALRTNAPRVYAIGDVLGPERPMLAHVAAAEGVCAVRNALAPEAEAVHMDYSVIPAGIFTSPEIGCVGLSQEAAEAKGIRVYCPQLPLRELGKAHAMGALPGFVKLIVDANMGGILGAHIVGARASDIIAELGLAMKLGANVADIANTIHAHPTLAEGVYEAALLGMKH